MNPAWYFVAGWLSASGFILAGMAWHYRRRTRGAWLDAQDSEQFAAGCADFISARGL